MSELLHRQVHPTWVQAGRVTSQAFVPSAKDEGKLSVARGSIWTAKEAFEAHTRAGFKSVGVWSVSRDECESTVLAVVDDPISTNDPYVNPAHAFCDFRGKTTGAARSIAQRLAKFAMARECQYADTESAP